MRCTVTNADCEALICYQQGACMMARGVGYRDCGTPENQIDTLEAHSLKYTDACQLMQLSSGKFALFGAYVAKRGIELIAIGTWAELEPHVRAYKALADAAHEQDQTRVLPAKQAVDYENLFGED